MKVLLAAADNEYGSAIADFVSHHKWPEGTSFRILHVIEWTPPERELTVSATLSQYLENRRNFAVQVTDEMAKKIKEKIPDCAIEEVIMEGSPVQRIIASANGWKADMIVVGSHGRKGVSLMILGSVSLGVVSNANCSVVVIRLPAAAEHSNRAEQETKAAGIGKVLEAFR